MTTFNPIFRSPIMIPNLPSLRKASDPQLTLSDLTGVQITLIHGDVSDLLKNYFSAIPTKPGELVDVGGGLLACLTPREFCLFGLSSVAQLPSAAMLDETFAKNQHFAHATDTTHGKAVLRLAGIPARELLSKICGLDFHDTVFPTMHVAQTSAAKIKTLIARCDENGTPTYFLHVNRPLGQYFWEVVWDVGQEFGIRPA